MTGAQLSRLGETFPGSEIRKMFAMASQYPNAISLAIGEPNFPTPTHIVEAAARAVRGGDTHYTLTAGSMELREAIAQKVAGLNHVTANPADEIMVTIGAVGAIQLAMMTTLNAGDDVLLPDPAWPNYIGHALMVGARPVGVPLREDKGFKLQVADLEAASTPRTRVLLLNTPQSPTGAVLTRAEQEQIAEFALRRNMIVITDEVYQELIYDGQAHFSIGSLPEMRDRTIHITSFSKSYAMTGWRIGYAVGPKPLIGAMTRMQECTASCPPSVAQAAALAALRGPQDCVGAMRDQYDQNRKVLVNGLNQIPGIHCVMPQGAFYAFPSFGTLAPDSWAMATRLLRETQVVAVPGSGFGKAGEGYLRFSLAASGAQIQEALARMTEVLAR